MPTNTIYHKIVLFYDLILCYIILEIQFPIYMGQVSGWITEELDNPGFSFPTIFSIIWPCMLFKCTLVIPTFLQFTFKKILIRYLFL